MISLKTAWLYKLSDFRDTFPKKVFYVLWWKSMLKLAIWQIPGVSEGHFWISGAVFLKMGPKGWNLKILPFLQNYGWNGLKTHQEWFWELKYLSLRPWRWKIGEMAIFGGFTLKSTGFDRGQIYLGKITWNATCKHRHALFDQCFLALQIIPMILERCSSQERASLERIMQHFSNPKE